MSRLSTPFHHDYVGSFLRPAALKEARLAYEAGKIGKAELTQIEDDCIRALVAKQKELGYHVITTASSAAPHGIWTSCGDLTASATSRPKRVSRSMASRR